jgi:hypothetical protein
MVISATRSYKIEFASWLGVLAQPVVAERFFHKIRAIFHKIRATPRLKQQKKVGRCACAPGKSPALFLTSFQNLPSSKA